MQFWPRKRAQSEVASVRSWPATKESNVLGFAGYKVGMTHAMIVDNRKTTLTKGESIFCPITVIECPPLKTASIRFYNTIENRKQLVGEIFSMQLEKELERSMIVPKKVSKKVEDIKDFDEVRLLVYTQPKATGIGKKKPDVFELGIGGKKEDQLRVAQEKLGKDITVKDVLKEGQQVDLHSITKGKGFQGPVKRFGVSLRSHKSEKVRRGPGTLGGWKSQGHFMYRVAHAGKMGYHQRIEYNKWIIKIGEKGEEINAKGGFMRYGLVKNPYILLRGSVGGPAKRLIRMVVAMRPKSQLPAQAPTVSYLSLHSHQGN
ncbi:50S ribosomal protein L3 [Candidatus Woesearchaeota archaeon]|nr:50S ribosomal protein L3 [Candidatus Woesearchaeota archaeon]